MASNYQPQKNPAQAKYDEVECLRNSSGMVAVITKATDTKQHSVAFYKEFERSGRTERTTFAQRRHLDGLSELVRLAASRIDELADIDKAASRMTEAANRRA